MPAFDDKGPYEFRNGAYYVHTIARCEGSNCVIHNPSDHKMKDWPRVLLDSALVERQCDHDIGHPDPDSLAWLVRTSGEEQKGLGVHSCDGCCTTDDDELKSIRMNGESIERITWIDSGMHLDEGWASTAVYAERAKNWNGEVVTVGTVFHEDDKVVVVGLSRDTGNGNWYGAQLIYKSCITEREELF